MTAEEIRKKIERRTPGLAEVRKESAVLLPLIEREEGLSVLFEQRTANISHAGETCFPGGCREEGESPIDTVIRETEEEIGLHFGSDFEIYGKYGDFLSLFGMRINIFVGRVFEGSFEKIKKQESEVADVFTFPLDFLANTEPLWYRYNVDQETRDDFPFDIVHEPRDYKLSSARVNMPIWQYNGHTLWGMTARMMYDFLQNIVAGE